jgi:Arc/MetJ-type ribon-helix-helix transcriptional regulator
MSDTEKITINMSAVDLGRVDLLVEEGFYSNRTDFIRTAIRKELDVHGEVVRQTIARRLSVLGVLVFSRQSLEQCRSKGEKIDVRVVGAAYFDDDISPALARETIRSVKVHGVLRARQALKDALADRIQ